MTQRKREIVDSVADKANSALSWMKSQATTALEYGKRRAEIAVDNLETKLVDAITDFAYD